MEGGGWTSPAEGMDNGHFAQQLIHCLCPVKTECKEVGELHMGTEDGLLVSPVERMVRPSLVGRL